VDIFVASELDYSYDKAAVERMKFRNEHFAFKRCWRTSRGEKPKGGRFTECARAFSIGCASLLLVLASSGGPLLPPAQIGNPNPATDTPVAKKGTIT